MKRDYKYFPTTQVSEIIPLDSTQFKMIKEAYVREVIPFAPLGAVDLDKQAISLQKITMFFDKGKTRNRYVLIYLEPTADSENSNKPSPHLLMGVLYAYELAGSMKIIYVETTESSICICDTYESDLHLN